MSYVHINNHVRDKLNTKSQKCTFIGYGIDEFGYRLWNEQKRKSIRNRDDVFDERVLYKDRDNKENNGSTRKNGDSSEYLELEDLPNSSVAEHSSD